MVLVMSFWNPQSTDDAARLRSITLWSATIPSNPEPRPQGDRADLALARSPWHTPAANESKTKGVPYAQNCARSRNSPVYRIRATRRTTEFVAGLEGQHRQSYASARPPKLDSRGRLGVPAPDFAGSRNHRDWRRSTHRRSDGPRRHSQFHSRSPSHIYGCRTAVRLRPGRTWSVDLSHPDRQASPGI